MFAHYRRVVLVLSWLFVSASLLACGIVPTPTATKPAVLQPTARPTATPVPTPSPTATPMGAAVVCKTDGEGVMVRVDSACQTKGAVGLLDNTRLEVTGIDAGCAAVKLPDGTQGYVPSQFLCPVAVPTAVATPVPPARTPTLAAVPTSTTSEPTGLDWSQAKNYVGQAKTVCGTVIGASYGPDVQGQPLWLSMGGQMPSPNRFQVIIVGQNEGHTATPPEEQYLGHWICITGTISLSDGVATILTSEPARIYVR
jgi:hypothetical protein